MKRRTLIGSFLAGCMLLAINPTFAQQKTAKKKLVYSCTLYAKKSVRTQI